MSFDASRLKLARELPEIINIFRQLQSSVISNGALEAKQKELIAVGIAVAIRCSPCITNHVSNALQMGISRNELLEAISVAMLMGGGPAVAYAAEAVKIMDKLTNNG